MYVGCVVIKSRTSETRPLCTIRVKTAVILKAKNMCYYLLPPKNSFSVKTAVILIARYMCY